MCVYVSVCVCVCVHALIGSGVSVCSLHTKVYAATCGEKNGPALQACQVSESANFSKIVRTSSGSLHDETAGVDG